jgi:hypothetical protein
MLMLSLARLVAQITAIPTPQHLSTVLPRVSTAQTGNVQPGDVVFPHFAFGGGWNTVLVIVNMTSQTVTFDQYFVDQSGNPLSVTFQTIPDGRFITTSAAHGTLPANQSFNILLFDPGPGSTTQVGWSFLAYDIANTRLGGFAIFQHAFDVGTFEALVPLSSMIDYKFYMPFDNRAGFTTSMAMVNPNTVATTATLTFRDTNGQILATVTRNFPPLTQQAFDLAVVAPPIRGFAGTVQAQGTTMFLSALGFRFNLTGGAFATVPVMNWSGMFP